MAFLATGLASKALKSTGLFSNDEPPANDAKPTSDEANITNPTDVQKDATSAGSELIKTICSTLNSPQNHIFSSIVESSVKTYFSKNNPDAQKTILATIDSKLNRIFDSLISEESNAHVFRELIKNNQADYETWFLEIIDGIKDIPEFKEREFSAISINRESAYRISNTIVSAIKNAIIPSSTEAGTTMSNDTTIPVERNETTPPTEPNQTTPPATSTPSSAATPMTGGTKKKRYTYKYRLGIPKRHTRYSHVYNLWGGGDSTSDVASSLENEENELKNQYKKGEISEEDAAKQTNELLNKTNEIIDNKTEEGNANVGCDNLIDKIVAGKVLNDYEKMILKYMDFGMKPNMDGGEINSKIMFVVSNAIDKQLSTDKFQLFLREQVQQELPGLVSSAVSVYGKDKSVRYALMKKMLEDDTIKEKMVNAFIAEINQLVKDGGGAENPTQIKMHNLKRVFELLLQ